MAKVYVGIDTAEGNSSIDIDSLTTGTGVEVVIDLAKVTSKFQAVSLLDLLKGRIAAGEWPPKDNVA